MKRSARSTRFPLAVHIMCMLAVNAMRSEKGYLSSSMISRSVAKNDVIVRKILGMLASAGLVTSASGSRGGARLARDASKINLLDIYKAVEAQDIFGIHVANEVCPVAISVKARLVKVFHRAEDRFEEDLATITLSDLAEEANRELQASPHREVLQAVFEDSLT